MKKIICSLLTILLLSFVVQQLPSMATPGEVTLVVASPEWEPGKIIERLSQKFTEYAQKVLGYPVKIVFDYSPWGTYYDRVATVFAARSDELDLVFADSQWLGEFAEGGHILKLNDFIEANPDLKYALFNDTYDNIRIYHCTYPQGSGNYYGVPGTPDLTKLLIVRKDLFTHPEERAAFKAKYGYDLPQTYEDFLKLDWTQLRDIAEFFTRKKGEKLAGKVLDHDFYGIALVLARDYDFISCYFLDVFWSWGNELWDPKTHETLGYMNSENAIDALKFFVSLVKYMPPGAPSFGYDEVITAYAEGRVAMTALWPSMQPAIYDPKTSLVWNVSMTVVMPGHLGKDGKWRRVITLGGQPLVVSAYSSHKKEALLYLKWFYTNKWFQEEFAKEAGFTARKSIAESEWFAKVKPWSRAFKDSMKYAKDFWNVPFYMELLEIQQIKWNEAVAGKISPEDAMNYIAKKQHEIVAKYGYLGG